MDRHELNKMFDGLAPDPYREREMLKKLLQDDARRKAPMKNWKRVVVGAAAAALLVTGAAAAYDYYVRKDVPVDPVKTVQGILGGGQPSWDESHQYDEFGHEKAYPRREVVSTDPLQAQALLGDYLPECGYQWQLGDYTLTVEGYVLDEHTGAAKFYYTVEHPGGFGEGAVDWEHGLLDWTRFKPSVTFKSGADQEVLSGRTYVDTARSTEEKLCIVESAADEHGWKAEDNIVVSFRVLGDVITDGLETYRGEIELSAQLELPGLKSLPTVTAVDPVSGTVAELSAIGLKLGCEDMDELRYIALDYADGTRYVVSDRAGNLDNADHGLGSGSRPDMTLRLVFNRLVDPSQVVAIIVDGQRYEVS